MVAIAPEINLATAAGIAPAKLNLTLEVLHRRDDGFHDIRSLVIGIALSDDVSATSTVERTVAVATDVRSLNTPENLAAHAARLLRSTKPAPCGVALTIAKRIPIGGGLGGGSSDAAAALRLCNKLWSLDLSEPELAAVGAELGSDVPLFFALPSALITGRGEQVEPVQMAWSGWALLVSIGEFVSTPAVYETWSRLNRRKEPTGDHHGLLEPASGEAIMNMTFNDLEPAVFEVAPRVHRAFDAVHALGLGTFRISGAGSTLYRLYDEEEAARHAAGIIEAEGIGEQTAVAAAPIGAGPIQIEE